MAELPKDYDPQAIEPRWYARWIERAATSTPTRRRPRRRSRSSSRRPTSPARCTWATRSAARSRTSSSAGSAWRRTTRSGCRAPTTPASPRRSWSSASSRRRRARARHDLGREEFVERVWEWKRAARRPHPRAAQGARRSLDWERAQFTMDAGLLARRCARPSCASTRRGSSTARSGSSTGARACRTALSDLEVEHDEGAQGELCEFAYPLADGAGELVVATTRPETMLGDTAVAVHPDDPRYTAPASARRVVHPLVDREIPIIADADPRRSEVRHRRGEGHAGARLQRLRDRQAPQARRDQHPRPRRHDQRRTAAPFAGMDRFEARKARQDGARGAGPRARRRKPHVLALPALPALRHRRRADALDAVVRQDGAAGRAGARRGRARARPQFVPESWTKTYVHWMTQHPRLVHLAPALVGPPHPGLVLRRLRARHGRRATTPDALRAVRRRRARRRTRTCSTPGSRRGSGRSRRSAGRSETRDAARPSTRPTVLETGYDILFFWVARMMMMGLHFMKKVPFRTVYLHAMVRDENGEKMSKVKGNVIDPLDVIARKHGADRAALRARLARRTRRRRGNEHQALDGATSRTRARLRQQDLERDALRADEPARATTPIASPTRMRRGPPTAPSSICPSAGSSRALQRAAEEVDAALEELPLRRRRAGGLPLRLGRALRLVHRARQAGAVRRRERGDGAKRERAKIAGRARRPRSRRRCACCIRSCRSSPRRSGSSCPSRRARPRAS